MNPKAYAATAQTYSSQGSSMGTDEGYDSVGGGGGAAGGFNEYGDAQIYTAV